MNMSSVTPPLPLTLSHGEHRPLLTLPVPPPPPLPLPLPLTLILPLPLPLPLPLTRITGFFWGRPADRLVEQMLKFYPKCAEG